MPWDDLVFADSIDANDRSIVLSKDSPDRDRSDRLARRVDEVSGDCGSQLVGWERPRVERDFREATQRPTRDDVVISPRRTATHPPNE